MSWIDGVRHRLREALHPTRLADEFDEEVRDHAEREAGRQAHDGLVDAAARRRARLRTGSLDAAREAAADGRTGQWLVGCLRDVRFASRSLRRTPGLVAAVTVSFALGIGGASAIFGVVHAVLLRPLDYPRSDELHEMRIWWNDFSATLSPADFFTLTEQGPMADLVGAHFADGEFAMETPSGPELVQGSFVTASLPRVLGVAPAIGPGLSHERGRREALISDAMWRAMFEGRPDVIGATLLIDGDSYAVVGVMPSSFHLPGRRAEDVWLRGDLNRPTRRGPFFLRTIVRLPADAAPTSAETQLTAVATPMLRDGFGVKDRWRYGLRPLKDVLVGGSRETLVMTFAAVALVLLIAVANVANLLLARGTTRTREMAVRAALGAGRRRLMRQLLTESSLLGLLGGAAGLLVAAGIVEVLRAEAVTIVPRIDEVRVDPVVVAFALLAGAGAGLAAGVLPAFRLPWNRLNDWIRGGGRGAGEDLRHRGARQLLVVGEIALALTVLTSAALLVKSLVRLQQTDPGFHAEGLISFGLALPNQPYQEEARVGVFVTDLDRRLRGLPGVRDIALSSSLPPNRLSMTNNYTLEGAAADSAGTAAVAEWLVVSDRYFQTLGIPLKRGRAFDGTDRDGSPQTAVVNEAFVRRHFASRDALGARLKGGNWNPRSPWITIVGVVADVPYDNGALTGSSPTIYTAYAQNLWVQSPYVVVRSDVDAETLVPAIAGAVAAVDARIPLRDVATMRERLRQSTEVPRFRGLMFSSLGVLGLVLALTGVYGVMAYHVTARRRETAIRRALGARPEQIVGMTLATGARLALAGIAIGTFFAFLATRSLARFLYQVEPKDPAVLGGTALLLAAAALVACGWPALQAARVDPAMLLRDE